MPELNCFIVMPVATRPEHEERYSDSQHWKHVMETLFVPAIRAAGMNPITPVADGSDLIHGRIIQNLSEADMVLCDLSSHNPNAFFELGVRTSLNRPIALVRDEHTSLPFDTAGINTYKYRSTIKSWEIERDRDSLAEHLRSSITSCEGENPLWRQFGLTLRAQEPKTDETREEAKIDLIAAQIADIQQRLAEPRQHRGKLPPGIEVSARATERNLELLADFRHQLSFTGLMKYVKHLQTGSGHSALIALTPSTPPTILKEIRTLASRNGIEAIFVEWSKEGGEPEGIQL